MMENKKYVIGLDFGSLSARGVLVEISSGTIVAQSEDKYRRGILDVSSISKEDAKPDTVIVDAQDYTTSLRNVIKDLMQKSKAAPRDVAAIGSDFTASTMIPLGRDMKPLSEDPRYSHKIHCYGKLWKHHADAGQAAMITEILREQDINVLESYGGKITPECMLPKIIQIMQEDLESYDAAYKYIEASDYLVSCLTGHEVRSKAIAECKNLWDERYGYLSDRFWVELGKRIGMHDEDIRRLPAEKLGGRDAAFVSPWQSAGHLTDEMAHVLGLTTETIVVPGQLDAHAGITAAGIHGSGGMLLVVGTSTGMIFEGPSTVDIKGMCSIIDDCDYPGLTGYAAGQSSTGDCYNWFMEQGIPDSYNEEASEQGTDVYQVLTGKAAKLRPGESGLLALDWWNGNRSCLQDPDLSGMILGLRLETKPEEAFRSLLEASALGVGRVIREVEKKGINIDDIHACVGISLKNQLLMQIIADVTGRDIKVHDCMQMPALGSAIYAAASLGKENGGYKDIFTAADAMKNTDMIVYHPDENDRKTYLEIQDEYDRLYDYFGGNGNLVMHRMREIIPFRRRHIRKIYRKMRDVK